VTSFAGLAWHCFSYCYLVVRTHRTSFRPRPSRAVPHRKRGNPVPGPALHRQTAARSRRGKWPALRPLKICWNVDISNAPVDWRSSAFIDFINADSIKRLHPGFGGDMVPGGDEIWGFPYIVLNGSESRSSVTFEYANQSDGVDHRTGERYPFYPIPDEAIWRPHLIQGGFPGNIDHRWDNDRHMLLVDGMNKQLYELDGVYFNQSQWRWEATSGAFFDLNSNAHRPEGWTSLTTAATCRPRVPTTLDGIMISSIQRFTS